MTRFASAAGVRLAYDLAGAGDPPMVFVHGWCCDRSYFAPQITHFSASHAVAAVDLRGHGESDRPAPGPGTYDIAVLAQDVLAVAAAAGLGQPVLVGHSLGALAGLVCAARPDGRVRPFHPARSPRPGERHDRAIPGDHRPVGTQVTRARGGELQLPGRAWAPGRCDGTGVGSGMCRKPLFARTGTVI
jgi:pimeloyl-ACP methyl ester carboxylesterase